MEDFLLYKTLISPMLVTIVSYVLMVIFVFGGLYALIAGETDVERFGGLVLAFLAPLYIRLTAEVIIVLFRINNTLTEIRKLND